MPHGHHGGGGFHHGGHHHHHHHHHGGYHHHRHIRPERIGLPLFGLPLLGLPLLGFGRPRYYYGPRYRRSGCSIFTLLFGILILFAAIHLWWLLIPLAILTVFGIRSLLKSLTNRSAGPGANSQPYYQPYQPNQPYQAQQYNQPYQQGYSAPPPGSSYQQYPPQSGWGQYDMPQAHYPQNMPPMP